jgi:hypothetical protein
LRMGGVRKQLKDRQLLVSPSPLGWTPVTDRKEHITKVTFT